MSELFPGTLIDTPADIRSAIAQCQQETCLWLDTEVADCFTKQPRLSLIQVATASDVMVLDVLDRPALVAEFIGLVMIAGSIEKVFHNASFDLRFLGGATALNVTCTYQMAKKIPVGLLPVNNHQLKTLAEYFVAGVQVDKSEQVSDWSLRPLRPEQLYYAQMDAVYLAKVHQGLLALRAQSPAIEPAAENIAQLSRRYQELEQQIKPLTMERDQLKDRLQSAMAAQGLRETPEYRLQTQNRSTKKCSLAELAQIAAQHGLDVQIALPKDLQQQLGDSIDQLNIQTENSQSVALKPKS
jgi:ribonuclease D